MKLRVPMFWAVLAAAVAGCTAANPGAVPYCDRFPDRCVDGRLAPVPAPAPAPAPEPVLAPVVRRTGPVRADGHALSDDQGRWNPLGASLFWALWGEAHDADKLERNLDALHSFDFVRIFGMVGHQPNWQDRVIDPHAADYWQVVDRLFARLDRHGIRAAVTLFADAQELMPDLGERQAFADRWRDYAAAHRAQVMWLEVVNEGWQNGFDDADQVRAIGARLAQGPVLVALSAPPDDNPCPLYAGSAADVGTMHYDRLMAEGGWRPQRQPWGAWGEYYEKDPSCDGDLDDVLPVNNEPVGPRSSVNDERDVVRLATGMATTFVAGNVAHVFHAGQGVYGGNAWALAHDRGADYTELSGTLDALRATRDLLPAGLSACSRQNDRWAGYPFAGVTEQIDAGALVKGYVAICGDRLAGTLMGISRAFSVTARRPMTLTLHDPRDGRVTGSFDLAAGDSWSVGGELTGLVLIGSFR